MSTEAIPIGGFHSPSHRTIVDTRGSGDAKFLTVGNLDARKGIFQHTMTENGHSATGRKWYHPIPLAVIGVAASTTCVLKGQPLFASSVALIAGAFEASNGCELPSYFCVKNI